MPYHNLYTVNRPVFTQHFTFLEGQSSNLFSIKTNCKATYHILSNLPLTSNS